MDVVVGRFVVVLVVVVSVVGPVGGCAAGVRCGLVFGCEKGIARCVDQSIRSPITGF